MPHVWTADGIEHGVHTLAREAVNFFHEVLVLVIDGDAAEGGNGRCPSR